MRTAAICSTKNEADIIEAFVRLNAKVCDAFFFADDSTDHTRAIIDRLADEGYKLHYLPRAVSEGEYNQPHGSQLHLNYVADLLNPDWIFFLDADEIIVADHKASVIEEIRELGPTSYLSAAWHTYVPASLGYFSADSPLSECFAPRVEAEPIYTKVSIPGRLARVVSTTTGNHGVTSLIGLPPSGVPARSYFLAHFPVRSSEQIIVKNLVATHNLDSRPNALVGEGTHVRRVLEAIRERAYHLTLTDVQAIANGYATPAASTPARAARPPVLDSRFACPWKYRDLAQVDVVARLDAEIERYAAELRRVREGLRSSPWSSVRLQLHAPDSVA
jgi:hypothetical protein